MTEIPEHLMKRAQQARAKATGVSMPNTPIVTGKYLRTDNMGSYTLRDEKPTDEEVITSAKNGWFFYVIGEQVPVPKSREDKVKDLLDEFCKTAERNQPISTDLYNEARKLLMELSYAV